MISHSVIDLTGGLLGERSTSDIIALTQEHGSVVFSLGRIFLPILGSMEGHFDTGKYI